MANPLFIISSGRSGSTLLASMLNMHPVFHVPVELIGLYSYLPWRLRFYGDLNKPFNRLLLARDLRLVGQLREFGIDLDAEPLADRIGKGRKDFQGVVGALYDELLKTSGKQRLVDKTPNNGRYAERIARTWPESEIIHLVRDGRDVALSSMSSRRGINFRNTFELGCAWGGGNLRRAAFGMRNRHRYHRLRYEDLVSNPEAELQRLCNFLNVRYDGQMLDYADGDFARRNAARLDYHPNLVRKVMSDNVGKWRKAMPARHRRLYEALSGKALVSFGYDLGPRERASGWWILGFKLAVMTAVRAAARGIRSMRVHCRWLALTGMKRRLKRTIVLSPETAATISRNSNDP